MFSLFVIGIKTGGTTLPRSNQPNSAAATKVPTSCATMNAGVSIERIPANVSLAALASVTAGLANEVGAVN
ncbi:hypothetical protein GCM10027296_27870 [Chitinimonas naiadis]